MPTTLNNSPTDSNHLPTDNRHSTTESNELPTTAKESSTNSKDLPIAQKELPTTSDDTSDLNTTAGDWHSHLKDQWVQDELKEHPDWHPMEGLHPGEIAVGNWEPTKDEKAVLAAGVDKLEGPPRLGGPITVELPDGSIAEISRVDPNKHAPGRKRPNENDADDENSATPNKKKLQMAGFKIEQNQAA